MPELPDSVPKGPFVAACALLLVGFVAIIFVRSVPGILVGSVLLLAGAGIGAKLALDLWKATE